MITAITFITTKIEQTSIFIWGKRKKNIPFDNLYYVNTTTNTDSPISKITHNIYMVNCTVFINMTVVLGYCLTSDNTKFRAIIYNTFENIIQNKSCVFNKWSVCILSYTKHSHRHIRYKVHINIEHIKFIGVIFSRDCFSLFNFNGLSYNISVCFWCI